MGLYSHSGKMGDLVFGLAAIREHCRRRNSKASLVLYDDHPRTGGIITDNIVRKIIAPLVTAQPYIAKCYYSPRIVHTDFSGWRDHCGWSDLVAMHGACLNLMDDDAWMAEPWLTVPEPVREARFVLARSPRYHDWDRLQWHWKPLVQRLGADQCVFVGLGEEHRDFTRLAGCEVRHIHARDLLHLAQIIAGADLFIGNASCPQAIAAGLNKPRIFEYCMECDNAHAWGPEVYSLRGDTPADSQRIDRMIAAI